MPDQIEQRVVVTDSAALLEPGIESAPGARRRRRGRARRDDRRRGGGDRRRRPAAIIGLLSFRGRRDRRPAPDRACSSAPGIGYDIIDVEAATAAGIWVANVPDYCVDEVADHAMLLLLSAWRRLTELEARLARRSWVNAGLVPPVHRARGRRLGIVGFGRIGRAVAQPRARLRLRGRGPRPARRRRRPAGGRRRTGRARRAVRDERRGHAPLPADARDQAPGRRGAAARVRPGLVLVNTSRGGLVDLAALDAALEDGRIAAVGLDVLEDEPAPDLTRALFQRPNVLLTPHLAWYSIEARRDLALQAAEEAYRYISGERPLNIVNPAARAGALTVRRPAAVSRQPRRRAPPRPPPPASRSGAILLSSGTGSSASATSWRGPIDAILTASPICSILRRAACRPMPRRLPFGGDADPRRRSARPGPAQAIAQTITSVSSRSLGRRIERPDDDPDARAGRRTRSARRRGRPARPPGSSGTGRRGRSRSPPGRWPRGRCPRLRWCSSRPAVRRSLRLGVERPLGRVVADRRERALVDLDDRAAGVGERAELRVQRLGQAQRERLRAALRRARPAGRSCTAR